MKPVELESRGTNCYCVRFEHDGKDIEYAFIVEGESVQGLEDWRKSWGDKAQEYLRNCILNFHKAKSSLMQDVEPLRLVSNPDVRREVHNKKMIPLRLESIGQGSDGDNLYRVHLDQSGKTVNYVFDVDDEIGGIGWEHQFWLDVDGELDVARPLFHSIGGFCDLEKALRS